MMFSRTTCMLFVLLTLCLSATNSIKVSKNTENSDLERVYTADEVHDAELKADAAHKYYLKCQAELDAARKLINAQESAAAHAARVKKLEEIAAKAKGAWEGFTATLGRMRDSAKRGLSKIGAAIAGAGKAVAAGVSSAAHTAAAGVSKAAQRVATFISQGWNKLRVNTRKACDETLNAFKSLGNLVGEQLEHAKQGMVDGITSVRNACKSGWRLGQANAKRACDTLTTAFHNAETHWQQLKAKRALAKANEKAALEAQIAEAEIQSNRHRLAEAAARKCYDNVVLCCSKCKRDAALATCENDCASSNLE